MLEYTGFRQVLTNETFPDFLLIFKACFPEKFVDLGSFPSVV